jgi:hypothetical protein
VELLAVIPSPQQKKELDRSKLPELKAEIDFILSLTMNLLMSSKDQFPLRNRKKLFLRFRSTQTNRQLQLKHSEQYLAVVAEKGVHLTAFGLVFTTSTLLTF